MRELHGYTWPTDKAGAVIKDRNPVGSRHCLDGLRYCTADLIPTDVADPEKERWNGGDVFWMRLARTGSTMNPFPIIH